MSKVKDHMDLNDMVEFVEYINQIQAENSNNKPCIYLDEKAMSYAVAKDDTTIEDKLVVVSSDNLTKITDLFRRGAITEESDLIFEGIADLMKMLTEYEDSIRPDDKPSDTNE